MFGGFERARDPESKKRMVWSTAASIGSYLLVASVVVLIAKDPRTAEAAKEVAVVFRPPPPPAPAVEPAPLPVAPAKAAAKKVVPVSAPKPLVAPEQIPDQKPAEAEPVEAVQAAGASATPSDGFGPANSKPAEAAPPAPPPAAPKVKDPINLPEAATPPAPADDNVAPEYPGLAREKGLEGLVILKVVVTEHGEVSKIQVLKGDEPFVAAAIAAVKTWRYSPALVEGQATAVFRILKIPFRIKS